MPWQPYFPFPEWRPAQAQGLDFICRELGQANDIMLEAPTGIGKSAIAIALARCCAKLMSSATYISTTTIKLENQYMLDFAKLGLRQLHAKSHYDCPTCRKCDVGSREIKLPNGSRGCRCQCGSSDGYKRAKVRFWMADFSIANAAYMCACARFAMDWVPRHIAIFDEAHLLHDAIASGYSFDIHRSEVEFFPPEGDEPAWLEQHYSFWLNTQIRELQEQLDRTGEKDPEIQKICRKLERAEQKRENLQKVLVDDPQHWIFDQQEDRLAISPLWATRFAAALLPRIGGKRIYLSATLPGFIHQARYLGIDPNKAKFLALPSPFPVEHRLIHICPVVKWDYCNPGLAIVQACRAIEKILELHPSDRGLVHVSSYPQAKEIVSQCRSKRLITHENALERNVSRRCIPRFLRSCLAVFPGVYP